MVDDAKPTLRNDAKEHGTGKHRFGDRRVPSSPCSLRSLPTHGSVHARINDMSANCWPMVIISSGGCERIFESVPRPQLSSRRLSQYD